MAITKPGTSSWPNLIAQWRLSGLTQAEFCTRRGLSLPSFRYHLYKAQPRLGTASPHCFARLCTNVHFEAGQSGLGWYPESLPNLPKLTIEDGVQ